MICLLPSFGSSQFHSQAGLPHWAHNPHSIVVALLFIPDVISVIVMKINQILSSLHKRRVKISSLYLNLVMKTCELGRLVPCIVLFPLDSNLGRI